MIWKYRRTLAIVLLLLIAAASVAYWGNGLTQRDPVDITVIIKSTDASVEFWEVLMDGVQEAAQEFEANVRVTGSRTETDVDEQIALVEQAIQEKPDAIVLAANDYDRLVPIAEKVRNSGIKLIIVDSGINSDAAHSSVATDNVNAGMKAGEVLQSHVEGPAKVAIISYVKNAASQIDREKGARSILDGIPNIDLLDTYYVEGSERNAYLMAKKILRTQQDVVGIIGLNEPTTVGAGRAIQELGLKDKVTLIGFDSSVNEIMLLDEGVMKATVIQRPFQMGYLSIKTAIDAVKRNTVPRTIDTGSLVITKQNMYEEENQKLLFPFVTN
ncbi:substrate-binding domain-containing protein [Paenibacillus harenae]|uniref:substrate-binding domain-containing protein n=1 Tax=Paenibacillus harenae TaxID=306543 RepID=UPI002791EC36|nr:substrate-binding domain-containing protein [Paenibacillus harenae]MDQ0062308.1 ribose transport system substrate-binding protein [Paenibacillus harenae]